ncbi:MAG: hypothetical protein RQ936_04145 [Gammaproteobacteria bacterium]|nr:hypothetical protein [Gammaproteobacteria bacterium]
MSLFLSFGTRATLVLFSLLLAFSAHSEEQEKVDYLSLSALMIKEGDYAKAEEAIAKVDQKDEKLDRKKFYTLSGIISLNSEQYAKSIEEFVLAIEAGQDNKILYVYLAQAYMGLEKYEQALLQLTKTAELELKMPGIWLLRSQAYWLNKQKYKAWEVLNMAQSMFPDEKMFLRNKMFYAIELGLFQEAVMLGQQYIEENKATADDYVSLGDALRRIGKPEQALSFLERARLVFPGNKNVYVALAQSYMDLEKIQAAAMILEEGGIYHNKLYKDSAELYKKSKLYERAFYNNSRILDQKDKLMQRMALHLEAENYDQVLAMKNDLLRVRLLDKDEYQYVMAFAQFKIGDYDAAEAILENITDAGMFRKATELRKVMVDCADEKWLC